MAPEYYPLLVGIVCLYGRPLTHSNASFLNAKGGGSHIRMHFLLHQLLLGVFERFKRII
jgi:hypothetical protein